MSGNPAGSVDKSFFPSIAINNELLLQLLLLLCRSVSFSLLTLLEYSFIIRPIESKKCQPRPRGVFVLVISFFSSSSSSSSSPEDFCHLTPLSFSIIISSSLSLPNSEQGKMDSPAPICTEPSTDKLSVEAAALLLVVVR